MDVAFDDQAKKERLVRRYISQKVSFQSWSLEIPHAIEFRSQLSSSISLGRNVSEASAIAAKKYAREFWVQHLQSIISPQHTPYRFSAHGEDLLAMEAQFLFQEEIRFIQKECEHLQTVPDGHIPTIEDLGSAFRD